MIHAATMVSAGVYLIARFFPLITAGWHEAPPSTPTMGIIAPSSAPSPPFFAATIALAQNDIKRVLAYSPSSQLVHGDAIGIGAFVAAPSTWSPTLQSASFSAPAQ
jgi:NADH-quinone oxidoreductase subunit L